MASRQLSTAAKQGSRCLGRIIEPLPTCRLQGSGNPVSAVRQFLNSTSRQVNMALNLRTVTNALGAFNPTSFTEQVVPDLMTSFLAAHARKDAAGLAGAATANLAASARLGIDHSLDEHGCIRSLELIDIVEPVKMVGVATMNDPEYIQRHARTLTNAQNLPTYAQVTVTVSAKYMPISVFPPGYKVPAATGAAAAADRRLGPGAGEVVAALPDGAAGDQKLSSKLRRRRRRAASKASAAAAAAAEGTDPEGSIFSVWRLVVDESTGREYFWNELSGETRWEEPVGFAPPAARPWAPEDIGFERAPLSEEEILGDSALGVQEGATAGGRRPPFFVAKQQVVLETYLDPKSPQAAGGRWRIAAL